MHQGRVRQFIARDLVIHSDTSDSDDPDLLDEAKATVKRRRRRRMKDPFAYDTEEEPEVATGEALEAARQAVFDFLLDSQEAARGALMEVVIPANSVRTTAGP